MKHSYLLLLLFIIFYNCSEDDSFPSSTVYSVTPNKTFIGDTLTLVGQNLTTITTISLRNEAVNKGQPVTNFISKTDTEIKFIVPELYHQNVTVYANAPVNPGIEIELFGFIPYSKPNTDLTYRDARIQQLLNDDVVFYRTAYNNGRFKLVNNFTDKITLPSKDENLFGYTDYSYHYTSEYSGWIVASGDNYYDYDIYSFTNDINNRSFEYSISYEELNGESIHQIEFLNNNLAYIMNREGEMFQILNGQLTNFIDLYPNLINTPYVLREYSAYVDSFQVLEDNSIIIYVPRQKYIFRFSENNVNLTYFESNVFTTYENGFSEPVFFSNVGGFYSNQKIYKSYDYGLTWSSHSIEVAMDSEDGIQFIGGSHFLLHDGAGPNDPTKRRKYISTDNGMTWKLIYNSFDRIPNVMISNKYGIVHSSYSSRLYKFRKFPDEF